jgi:hypothetical protein
MITRTPRRQDISKEGGAASVRAECFLFLSGVILGFCRTEVQGTVRHGHRVLSNLLYFLSRKERLTRTASRRKSAKLAAPYQESLPSQGKTIVPQIDKSRCNSIVAGVCSPCDQRFPCLYFLFPPLPDSRRLWWLFSTTFFSKRRPVKFYLLR